MRGLCSQLLCELQGPHDRGMRGTGSSAHLPLLREVLQLLDVPLAQPVPQLYGLLLPQCGQLALAAAAWQLCLPLQGHAVELSAAGRGGLLKGPEEHFNALLGSSHARQHPGRGRQQASALLVSSQMV